MHNLNKKDKMALLWYFISKNKMLEEEILYIDLIYLVYYLI